MSDLKPTDELFYKIMQKSRLDMPFSDFEDNVMHRIERQIKIRDAISKSAKLSVLFFILGTVFGLLIGNFLSQSLSVIFDITKEQASLFFQIGYIVLFLTQLDGIFNLFNDLSKSSEE